MKTYSRVEIVEALMCQWDNKRIKLDWLAYEILVDKIYHSDLTADERNLASTEALDAFTKRGHFDPKNYLTAQSYRQIAGTL